MKDNNYVANCPSGFYSQLSAGHKKTPIITGVYSVSDDRFGIRNIGCNSKNYLAVIYGDCIFIAI
jgi:hypothetical protein